MISLPTPKYTEVKFGEFPELLFGLSSNNLKYCDATAYIFDKGDVKIHTIKEFKAVFHFFINAITKEYDISDDQIIIKNETDGHILFEESIAFLLIAYIEPAFIPYMFERIAEMFVNGLVISDTALTLMANQRLK